MQPTVSIPVSVSGAREEIDELTWGHLAIWQWHGVATHDESFNFHNAIPYRLPPGCTVASITAALAESLVRYDGLRTVIRREDGGWRQIVHGSGELTVAVYETATDDAGR